MSPACPLGKVTPYRPQHYHLADDLKKTSAKQDDESPDAIGEALRKGAKLTSANVAIFKAWKNEFSLSQILPQFEQKRSNHKT
ncbi:hypothetical protein KIN20_001217 [Parelaphostrongylus tenuis]|uniref:Uncharacterized protein n=1 Tax=Parelaphostrongylus tenuis TaxID=148309 RepID=A0AAD5MLV7_PARTN|nr:hypothetical protein KIN20_001217 [Parelaphostrongylus tenuis]